MPTISELAAMGIRYQEMESFAPSQDQQQQAKSEKEDGNFTRGFKKAMLQLPQTAGGAAALVGDLTGSQRLKEYGLGVYQKNADKIQAISKDSDSLSNVIEGDASGADWLANTAGYVVGQAGQAVLTGGVGGFIGSQLAKRGIKDVIARGAESVAARTVANKVAARGAAIGAGTAMLGSNFAQEAGSIYPEALHVAAEQGRELDGTDKARVLGTAGAAALVDTAANALMLRGVLKGARKPGEGLLRAGAREVPGAMAREGITEGIQTGIERYGAGQELGTADAIRDYVDSVGVGVVGGGMGGAASVLRSNKVPESGPLTRAANTSIEQQVLQLQYDPQPLIGFPDGTVGTKAEAEIWLNQFPEGEERDGKRRELMGRDPATGKRIKPKAEPEPTHAQTIEEEAAHMADWTAQHDPVDLDQAHAILGTPGAKGQSLMVAPHPDGGFTLVESNKLTIDTQARLADLQKPVKAEASKEGEPAATPEPVTEVANDAQPEWKTNPYTAFGFKDRELAEAFMVKRGADPLQFEAREVDGKFKIKRRETPLAAQPIAEEATNADNAILAQDEGAAAGSSDSVANLGGSNDGVRGGTSELLSGGRDAANVGTSQAIQPADVRATGSANADAALTDDGKNSIQREIENPTSWVLRNKETGEVIAETYDRAKVDALNTEKYEAVPTLQHLGELNDPSTKAYAVARGQAPAPDPVSMEATADVSERPQVPEEAPATPSTQGSPQDAASASAAGTETAGTAEAIGQVAPAPEAKSTIPLAFYKKVKVPVDVLNEETGATESVKIPADTALKSVREDIKNLEALRACMKS